MYLAPECITCGSFNVTAGLFGHFGWAWTARECCANGARRVTAADAWVRCSPSVSPHGCSACRQGADFLLRVPLTYEEAC